MLEDIGKEIMHHVNGCVLFVLQATKRTRREVRSTHVVIVSYPFGVLGRLKIEAVPIEPHLRFGTSKGVGLVKVLPPPFL